MVSFRISGNPTIYGLLALSAMELAASQKAGSPLAILQQPTKGFKASTTAASPQQAAPQPVSPAHLATATISPAEEVPSFAAPNHGTTTQGNIASQPVISINTTPFRDLQSHWSQPFVELLAARGIISGYADGTFQPDRDIQAAHFGMMLHQAKLYRLKVLQRELGVVASSTIPVSPPSITKSLRASTSATVPETEAAILLQTHDIRTRAQAAVFIYRNLQDPIVSQVPSTTESFAAQTIPISQSGSAPQPTFSGRDEDQQSPRLSETFQWSTIEPDWVAQG